MGFLSLQHIPATGVHFHAGSAETRFVPPSGFGYPLGGLLPPKSLAGLVSSRQRSWDSSLRSIPLSQSGCHVSDGGRTRMPLTRRDLPRIQSADRCDEYRLPGFRLCESPLLINWGLTRDKLEAPLGFCLSRVVHPPPCCRLPPAAPFSCLA